MTDALLTHRHTLFALRKVFARTMPYGTYLEVSDTPASLTVVYKGSPVLTVTDAGLETRLTGASKDEVLTALNALLPKEHVHG